MKGKIYHICHDEKFINSALTQFEEAFLGNNVFYVVLNDVSVDFIHIKEHDFVKKITQKELLDFAKSIQPESLVVLHSLSNRFYEFVSLLPKQNKVIWFCFGYEIYNDSNYFKNKILLDKKTRNTFLKPKKNFKKKFKNALRPFYRIFNKNLPFSTVEFKKQALKRIDYLGSSFYEEYKEISRLVKLEKAFFHFWYYPLELIVDVNKPIKFPKKNLQIGQSGNKTANHIDVFNRIKDYKLNADIINVPLNYGKSYYIDSIVNEGTKYLGKKFNPLLKFMPLEEYNSVLENVGVAVLNSRRQQAVGNTIALIWFGAKVFLSNRNTFYHYLKRIGVLVFCYETELSEDSLNTTLTVEQIETNRNALFEHLNRDKLSSELKQQINRII